MTFYQKIEADPQGDWIQIWKNVRHPIDRLNGLVKVDDDDLYDAAEVVLDHIREQDSENAHLLHDLLSAVMFRALSEGRVEHVEWAALMMVDLEHAFAEHKCRRWYS